MNKRAALAFIAIYLFLYILNYLHPMSFGDDYLYSFIWQGKPMSEPLSENAVRVASWHDIFVSQWSHYFTWGGRTVAHVLVQFFLWMGKPVFNFFNAFISAVLIAEIYWCINKGRFTFNFQAKTICWIFFMLWAFTPGFAPVFFWLTSACNYLWTNVILLAFLIPYLHKYYFFAEKSNRSGLFSFIMFLFGIIAGWTNENSVCWVIVLLLVFIIKCRNREGMEKWLASGLFGLLIGYALLIFAPGNTARFLVEQSGGSNWLNAEAFKANLKMFVSIFFFQIFLWFFSIRSIMSLDRIKTENAELKKEIILAKLLCVLSFAMTAIMFFSPGFPPRSGFSGTVYLIIAAGLLLRTQKVYGIELVLPNAKKFLFYVGSFYFVMTSMATLYAFCGIHESMQNLVDSAKQFSKKSPQKILQLEPLKEIDQNIDMMSGFHIPGFELEKDENSWINVAFARYYGIKGVRMVKSDQSLNELIK